MFPYGKLSSSALLLAIAWGGGIPAIAADIVEEKETSSKAQGKEVADTSEAVTDTSGTEGQVDTADTSEAVTDTSGTEKQKTEDFDQQFDQIHNRMTATHPEEAEQFKQEYHASEDKKKILEDWVHHALESQDMLDAIDELFAIYQILRNIDRDASNTFEQRVQDAQDPRNVLEYAHQLLLKTLKDRRVQIETAKSELRSIATILEYVSFEKAREIEQIKQSAEDPRARVDDAYKVLEETLEAAHKEIGLAPL